MGGCPVVWVDGKKIINKDVWIGGCMDIQKKYK